MLTPLRQALPGAMLLSIAFHGFVLFGLAASVPLPRVAENLAPPLKVVLVNSKSQSRPEKADALAQANLDGGGNTHEDRQASTPLPSLSDDTQFSPEEAARRVQELEERTRRMMTRLNSNNRIDQSEQREPVNPDALHGEEAEDRALQIARLEAQIRKNMDAYQKIPRRTFMGARAREYRFAQYIEDWRIKIERIGNLNYPEEARKRRLFGKLQLSVSIRADGSLEDVEVSRSSGERLLDAAAVHIVQLSAPFSPLPPDITRDTDILTITRTWNFTTSDRLEGD